MRGKKTGGRQKGSLDKSTIEKLAHASRQVGEARKMGRKMAIEVLDDLMHTAMGMAAKYQPPAQGADPVNPSEFKDWLQIAGKFAKALGEYQAPRLKAIMAVQPAPIGEQPATIDQEGNILDIDDPKKLARVYASLVRRVG